jgi:hypothetical protein
VVVDPGAGDHGAQDPGTDRRQQEVGEIAGYLPRRYENRRDGSAVSLLLVCGRPGPISNHIPEICYAGAGWAQLGERVQADVPDLAGQSDAKFWLVKFHKENPIPSFLRIFYAWNAHGAWQAPSENPRLRYASEPALYKLYVVRESPTSDIDAADDPSLAFLRDFLPVADPILFPSPGHKVPLPGPGHVANAGQ